MAKAVFSKAFNFTETGRSWRIRPAEKAQSFPQRVIDAAVAQGAAKLPDTGTTKAPADAGKSEG